MKRNLLTHQTFMKTATMGFIVLASTFFAPHTFAAPADRPNVILIYTDDHGYTDLGVLGIDKHVDTPNMDKLARGGALMTAGYSSAPQCQPSRAGLMVGRVQNEFAFPHNACDAGEGKGRMPRTYPKGTDMAGQPVLTIADRMKKLGYVTGFSGKWHLGPTNSSKPKHDPRGRGFDYYWTGTMNSGQANLTLDGKPAEHHAKRGLPKGVANRVILQGKYGESFIDLSQAGTSRSSSTCRSSARTSRSSRSPTRTTRTSPSSTTRTTTIGGTIGGAWASR